MYKFEINIVPKTKNEQILKEMVEAMLTTISYREENEILQHYLGEIKEQGISVNIQDE